MKKTKSNRTEQNRTEQEEFWATKHGEDYIGRNDGKYLLAGNLNLFSKIISNTEGIKSVLEYGSSTGAALDAIKLLLPDCELSGVEINKKAADILKKKYAKVYYGSMLDFKIDYERDLVFVKGVLINTNPDELQNAYQKLYEATNRYILVVEYYNPTPVMVPYHGHDNMLFKRDFAKEIMDKFPNIKLINYGFSYRKDNNFPQDDISWFLMEKH